MNRHSLYQWILLGQYQSYNTLKFNLLVLTSLIAIFGIMFTTTAQATRTISYCIEVKTWTTSGAGTDNNIKMKMYGSKGGKQSVWLKGHHENDDLDSFSHDMRDIGVIKKITLDVSGSLADKWAVNYVRIYRDAKCNNTGSADGWTEFSIQKELDYDPKNFYASYTQKPKVTVSPSGRVVINKERITVVNFANVSGSRDQEVMQFSESWSKVDEVAISRQTTNTVGAGLTISYESPQTVAGTFGAEASASWERAVSKARSESQQKITSSTFNWAFVAPARTFVMRRVTFEVPYADQIYKSSIGQSFAIRKVGAQIRPVGGAGEFLEIPQRNEDGSITIVGMDTLQRDWFAYLDPREVADIRRRYLNNWLRQGWVVRGTGGRLVQTSQPVSRPTPKPTPKITRPTVRPAIATKDNIDMSKLTTEGVTGRNVKVVHFGNNAKFVQTSTSAWTEYNSAGQSTFHFQETGRDDWSVYLNDPSRNMQLQLDLHRKMILLGYGGKAKNDQWLISKALRPGIDRTTQGPGGSFSTHNVNGRNVQLAQFAQGRFQQTEQGQWKEYNQPGKAIFSFQETGRDDWSVYLNDASRNVQIQLDIHRKMITYGVNGNAKRDLYPITAAKRPQ